MKLVTASLVIIGNEILSGRTHDKNIPHLATELNKAGIQLREVRVVPDIEKEIIDAVNAVRARYDYVFTTGGIGPTHDDITTASIAKAFGVRVVRSPEAEKALRDHYGDQINDARLKMADIAEGAFLIPNPVSTAPGFGIGNVFVMAGVPRIMQSMLAATIPLLKGGDSVGSLSVTTDLPEGTIAEGLTAIQNEYATVDIGSYPQFVDGKPQTTLVCRSMHAADNQAAMNKIHDLIQNLGGQILAV